MSVTPDAPDWAPHVALAAQVAATGVPLLRATNSLGSGNAAALAAGVAQKIIASAPVTQPGYEAIFQAWMPAASGTVPFTNVNFSWEDSATSLPLGTLDYMLASGNGAANFLQYYVRGPCLGDQLTVTCTDLDPAVGASVSFVVNQTSHIYEHDQIIQAFYAATPPQGFVNPAGKPTTGLILASTPTINPATTLSRLLAARSGRAVLAVDNFTGTNAMWAKLVDPGSLYSTQGAVSAPVLSLAAGAVASAEVVLPYGPMLLQFRNQGATGTIAPGITITGVDY